jgi:hypothetical protein
VEARTSAIRDYARALTIQELDSFETAQSIDPAAVSETCQRVRSLLPLFPQKS